MVALADPVRAWFLRRAKISIVLSSFAILNVVFVLDAQAEAIRNQCGSTGVMEGTAALYTVTPLCLYGAYHFARIWDEEAGRYAWYPGARLSWLAPVAVVLSYFASFGVMRLLG